MTRAESIELLRELSNFVATPPETDEALNMAIKALEQEPKRGKWIDVEYQIGMQCSECGKMCSEITLRTDMMTKAHWNYCPNCGARMESDTE